jgi:hypothetical protein
LITRAALHQMSMSEIISAKDALVAINSGVQFIGSHADRGSKGFIEHENPIPGV